MAAKTWIGNAIAVSQITNWLFEATWEATDIINITINGKTVSMVAGSTTITTIVTALATFLAAQTDLDFYAVVWTAESDVLVGTARVAGVPFVCTVATTETGGGAADAQTINGATSSTGTATQVATGPNWLSDIDNLSTGAILANGDDAIFDMSAVNCSYALDQTAVTLATLNAPAAYTGRVGLKRYGPTSGVATLTSRYEYLERYLKIKSPIVNIGYGEGAGTAQFYLDLLTTATAIVINKTAVPSDGTESAVKLLAVHANNTLIVNRGRVGVADEPGQVSTFSSIKLGQASTVSDARLVLGESVTVTTIEVNGGTLISRSGCTTLNVRGGIAYLEDDAVFTTINQDAGRIYYKSNGTITNLYLGPDAIFDCSQDLKGRTITNLFMSAGATFSDPYGTCTITNGIDLVRCSLSDVTINRPDNRTWTESAI